MNDFLDALGLAVSIIFAYACFIAKDDLFHGAVLFGLLIVIGYLGLIARRLNK